MPTTSPQLLSTDFMHRLERLDVLSRKMLRGKLQGERRSKKRGQSVEFADYRNYVMGDDLRFIDWNLYARLDKLFLRLFMEEEDLSVSIVLDTTASMNQGDPNKLLYAKQLAASLGYIALSQHNRVNLYAVTDRVTDSARNLRGRRPIPQMLTFLQQQTAHAPQAGDLTKAYKQVATLQRQSGVVILVSDFLDKGELSEGLRPLASDQHDTYAIQVLSPQETDPTAGQIVGDLRLTDVEDGDVADVSISPALLKRYRATLQAYCQHVREQCLRRGIAYMVSETSISFETVVLRYFRERGLLG